MGRVCVEIFSGKLELTMFNFFVIIVNNFDYSQLIM